MKNKLNILILHRMGDPELWRSSVRDIEFCLPDYAPEHNYIVHNAAIPLPRFVKDIEFHGIVLGPTFLWGRCVPSLLSKTLKEYDFIKKSKAFKIAMPQDDYDCNAILERWMLDWGIDVLYTVCPEHWEVLYPKLIKSAKIKLGYTAYISDELISRCKEPKPLVSRAIDVSYRSKKSYLGTTRYIKGILGEVFIDKVKNKNLNLDISTRPEDTIHGDAWLDFVENSKFVLGSNSGSSLLDPEGKIRAKVKRYMDMNPGADFKKVKKACFPKEDGRWYFTAISPRNIEAALLKTVQIITPGSYNGLMLPREHYIPLEPDGSNINEVLSLMKDFDKTSKISASCKDVFLSIKELRYSYHVQEIIDLILRGVSAKKTNGIKYIEIAPLISRYNSYIEFISFFYWSWSKFKSRAKKIVNYLLNYF